MNEISDFNTWGKAFALWFWTNLGGIIGVVFTFALFAMQDHHGGNWSGDWGILRAISLISFVVSLPMIPVAYGAFWQLLPIRARSARLLATMGAISAAFAAALLLACAAVNEVGFFAGAFCMGGWAYLLVALGSAAVLYSPALLRPDDHSFTPDNNIAA